MVKRKLKKLLALALSILMLSSSVTGLFPTAAAAEPDAVSPAADPAPLADDASTAKGDRLDFQDPDNGRPNLFVDFLGDNNLYRANGEAAALNTLVKPAGFDQSKVTNPNAQKPANPGDPENVSRIPTDQDNPNNKWDFYESADVTSGSSTIFWVGLGIDRREVLELLKGDKGLTGMEAGFYYDNRYIEPYVEPGKTYMETIRDANINNTNYPKNTQWSSAYEILRADTGMEPKSDLITQEELTEPTIDHIIGTTKDPGNGEWKMTYISLELSDLTAARRLQNEYKADLTDAPDAAHGTGMQGRTNEEDNNYQYLLLIPFKLKRYADNPQRLCLRLMRDATHFSIGGGQEGTEPYAAWERVTTRNPGKDIKLQTRFTGDLHLFTAGKEPDVEYSAQLIIDNRGGSGNEARLSVDGDPAIWPVYAERDKETIGGLRSGLGMKVEVKVQTGYTVKVYVSYEEQGVTIEHSYTTVVDQKKYTFVMPSFTPTSVPVKVRVVFEPGNLEDFSVYLSELQRTNGAADGPLKVGNETTVTTNLEGTPLAPSATSNVISTFSPPAATHPNHGSSGMEAHPLGPVGKATKVKPLCIDVSTHNDYEAVVRIYDYANTRFIVDNLTIDTAGRNDHRIESSETLPGGGNNPDYGKITLPYGGLIYLNMPESDIEVEVIYQKAQQHSATLEVFHGDGEDVTDMNVAQLVHLVYDDNNVSSQSYSGVVFEDITKADPDPTPYSMERHRALEPDPGRLLPWITKAESSLSLSLGGDTNEAGGARKGATWLPSELDPSKLLLLGPNTAMARLGSAAVRGDFHLSAIDVNTLAVLKNVSGKPEQVGLRKDPQGNGYGEEDMTGLEDVLWELRQQIMADPALGALYYKPVMNGSTTAYSYLDLTPVQVQAYLLDMMAAEKDTLTATLQYREALRKYQAAKAVYDGLKDMPNLVGLVAPAEPFAPAAVEVDAVTFKRTYQGEDYQNTPGATAADNGYLYDYNTYIDNYQSYVDSVKKEGSLTGAGVVDLTEPVPAQKPVKTVPILSDTDAEARVRGQHWEPSVVATGTEAHTIQTRGDRTVRVVTEADSFYTVESVKIYDKDVDGRANNLLQTITPPAATDTTAGYRNVFSFKMPSKDCVVRVTYVKRDTRDIRVQITGADGEADNLASVEAYRVTDHNNPNHPGETDPATTPTLEIISNKGHQSESPYPKPQVPGSTNPDASMIYKVFEDSTVTIRVKTATGYKVTVTASNYPSGTTIPLTTTNAVDPADGQIKTFIVHMPTDIADLNGRINISIHYEKDADTHDAYIDYDQNGITGATAEWRVTDGATVNHVPVIRNVSEGTSLLADIVVPPGAYIYGVVVYGASGSYPYTLSGNGYNGGFGAGGTTGRPAENIWVDMPDEDLYVHVTFAEGIPDPEPMNTLTLTVKDDDNGGADLDKVDPATAAPNWAKATIYDTAFDLNDPPSPAPVPSTDAKVNKNILGEVGKNKDHGNKTMTDWGYVPTGKWVVVEFSAADGYYVDKVTVGPSHLGVTVVWEDTDTISFYMPAGSTGVNVEFRKGTAKAHFLTVRETWMNANFQNVTDNSRLGNYVTHADSATIHTWNPGGAAPLLEGTNPERVPPTNRPEAAGVAVPGEEVTLKFNVDEEHWYVQSVVILSDGAAYRGAFYDTGAIVTNHGNTYHVYEVKFRQPTGDVEVTVHYRQGKRPDIDDYALTAVLYDDDNKGPAYDDNRLDLTISGTTGTSHADVHLGRVNPDGTGEMNAVRHPHAGDTVTLKTTLANGYSVQYLVIDPASLSLYPVWTDGNNATFTMPAQGVAVVARYIKGDPQEYTANLILHPPEKPGGGYYSMSDVGQGTFTAPTTGNLSGYPGSAIFSTVQPTGTQIGYDLYAFDGYYIDHITIEPAVGATGSLSGSFGYQNGDFVMPRANVNVNVWFKKGWPDEVKYDLTLEVVDSAYVKDKAGGNNSASFRQVTRSDGTIDPLDHTKVYGQDPNSLTLTDAAFDRDTVFVDIDPINGYYTNAQNILLTDTGGNVIPWWNVPGGIAFTMPPRSTTVRVTFLPIPEDQPKYTATLAVYGKTAADEVSLKTDAAQASPKLLTNDGVIGDLYAADVLELTAKPGTDRHIAAAYAEITSGSRKGEFVPLYDNNGALVSYVPGDPAAATQGGFAMPEGNVVVHVVFRDGAIDPKDKSVTLIVSGPDGSGSASAKVDKGQPDPDMTVSATGMDTRFTDQDEKVVVTFEPTDNSATGGDKYLISKLEVYDKNGKSVPYEWISMVQDPEDLSDTNMWPPPPTNPDPAITYPTWKPNDKLQIKLTVPVDSVTIHVTYAKATEKVYRAQVVVNDSMYSSTAGVPSRNNAWFENGEPNLNPKLDKKLQYAKPGEPIDLNLTVHPGYRIEYIVVIPQSFGISPGMPLGPYYDQTTGFVMPEGDVTVYVKFVTDDQPQYTATLLVTGAPVNNANFATISSPISGKSPVVYVNGTSQSVQARPVMDWITVDYQWAVGAAAVKSITIKTAGGDDVSFTQNGVDLVNGKGQIILPMVNQNIIVTITYDSNPVDYEVVLHVIDHTQSKSLSAAQANAKLDYLGGTAPNDTTGDVAPAADPGTTAVIRVPAGQTVDVSAYMDQAGLPDLKLESAYVLYEDGGQMVNLNLPNGTATPAGSFLTHPGKNDVYVSFTDKTLPENPHTAVLMLKAPEDNAGSAAISVGGSYNAADPNQRHDLLTQANHGHASVAAGTGEGIHINVVPNTGYVIDHILVTPLGFPLESTPIYHFTRNGNSYSFDMPHCNVAITVYLKRGTDSESKVVLHYLQHHDLDATVTESQPGDYAKLSWTPENEATRSIWADGAGVVIPGADDYTGTATTTGVKDWPNTSDMLVQAGAEVTLSAVLDTNTTTGKSDVILAAYVLLDGALVPLTPKHPADRTANTGLEGVAENTSLTDNTSWADDRNADAIATFIMPNTNKDVDVYLVTTNDPPPVDWHTVVVVANDTSPANGNDSGLNKGHLHQVGSADPVRTAISTGHPGHTFITLPEGAEYTVEAEPYTGYEFIHAKSSISRNAPPPGSLNLVSTLPYTYRQAVGNCNEAIHLVFESSDALKLTVEIEDRDNPGNGTVTNAVTTSTTGVPTLELTSVSALGSYQIMEGVTAAAPVDIVVKPQEAPDGTPLYSAMASYRTSDGTGEPHYITLTPTGTPGELSGSFPMPPNNTVLTVTFFKPYEGTLVLEDKSSDPSHRAKMTEDTGTPPDMVEVDPQVNPSLTLKDLPNTTLLTAQMTTPVKATERVTGLLTRNGSTTFLPAQQSTANPNDPEVYLHTIDRANATITLVVTDVLPDDHPYIAAVRAVDKPAGTAAPTIEAAPKGEAFGNGWTTAKEKDRVTATFDVPVGYEAVVTSDHANGPTGTFSGPLTGQTVSFDMPAADVQVTITYRKTQFGLTLRVVDLSGKTGNTVSVTSPTLTTLNLTSNGDFALVAPTTGIDVLGDPGTNADVVVRSIFYQPEGGPVIQIVPNNTNLGIAQGDAFTMPPADTVVTVIFDKERGDGPDQPKPYYIASTYLEYDSDTTPVDAGNRIVSIQNITRTKLDDGSDLPKVSPHWVAGYAADSVTVSYETAPGYYVTAVATRDDTGEEIPVVLLDHGTGGTATAAFPTPGVDVTIVIRYSKTPPTLLEKNVALQLVEHGAQVGNQARTNGGKLALDNLALNGTHLDHAPQYPSGVVSEDPVEMEKPSAIVGNDLRTLANWANNYQVVRMTVAVRSIDPTDPTNPDKMHESGEVDLLVSRYAGSATSRVTMPTVGDNEIAVIRVYYGNIYDATLHIVGATHNDSTSATDDRPTTITSTGADPITQTGDKLKDFKGNIGETVQTTAVADTVNGKRLVGVVWESPTTGADAAARQGTTDRYDFDMPKDNVDFYAVYEPESDNHSYIAKVKFADNSAHLGDSGNAVTISNTTDLTAVHGTYWTAAKANEIIVVNVKVAKGYQAQIITTHEDKETGHTGEHYDFYTSRTAFVPNLPAGRDATFTMPAATDATVIIRFVKGYDLSLEITGDISGHASAATPNTAKVTTNETTPRTLEGKSDDTGISHTSDGTSYVSGPVSLVGVPAETEISTEIGKAQTDTLVRVQRYSPFTGTVTIPEKTTPPGTWPSYKMPSENVAETVFFYEDPDTLFANVEVKGHSDINGNKARPIQDTTRPTDTTPGTVWTSTFVNDKLDLTITVAKGYLAKIKVRWDNENYTNNPTDPTQWDYLNPKDYAFDAGTGAVTDEKVDLVQMGFKQGSGAFGNNISDPQHFTFTMPAHSPDLTDPDKPVTAAPTDVTVIVEFVFAGTIPQPFDPDNMPMTNIDLERGFIYGENRGDFALIDIPTLYGEDETTTKSSLFDTDNYDRAVAPATKDAKKNVKFYFFLYDAANDQYTPLTLGTDVLLEPEDEKTLVQTTDPYNYYTYKTKRAAGDHELNDDEANNPENTYVGSRFKLIPTEPDSITGNRTPGAQALYEMLNNDGSLKKDAEGTYYTTLYVLAEDAIGQKSAYTQVWIRPHFTIEVTVVSYAPNHTTTAKLYQLMSQDELAVAAGYKNQDGTLTGDPDVSDPGAPNAMEPTHYRWNDQTKPYLTAETHYDEPVIGSSKYMQKFSVMSSELLGPYTTGYDPEAATLLANWDGVFDARYALTLEKASCLTYTRVNLDLTPTADKGFDLTATPPTFPNAPKYYDDATLTYTIADPIYLITGDVDGNGATKWQDYDTVHSMVWGTKRWNNTVTKEPDPTDPNYNGLMVLWNWSTYNPKSIAYRCDLNGDRELTMLDVQIVQTRFDYNRTAKDYQWTDPNTGDRFWPFGFGGEKGNYATLFALDLRDGLPIPVEPDEYWDALVDPETTDAPPINLLWVDQWGVLWADEVLAPPEDAGSSDHRPAHRDEDEEDAVMEIPEGDEIMDQPIFITDIFAELPADIIPEE